MLVTFIALGQYFFHDHHKCLLVGTELYRYLWNTEDMNVKKKTWAHGNIGMKSIGISQDGGGPDSESGIFLSEGHNDFESRNEFTSLVRNFERLFFQKAHGLAQVWDLLVSNKISRLRVKTMTRANNNQIKVIRNDIQDICSLDFFCSANLLKVIASYKDSVH